MASVIKAVNSLTFPATKLSTTWERAWYKLDIGTGILTPEELPLGVLWVTGDSVLTTDVEGNHLVVEG